MNGICEIVIFVIWYIGNGKILIFIGVNGNNFQDVILNLFLGIMICVIGVLGFGKLILINSMFYLVFVVKLNKVISLNYVFYIFFIGLDYFDKVIDID